MNLYLAGPVIAALLAIVFAVVKFGLIMRQDAGTEQMQAISRKVQEGAAAFLKAEYRWLLVFVVIVAAAIALSSSENGLGPKTAIAFVCGALASATAGYFGMHTATRAAVRTTQAARTGLMPALAVSFSSGVVMGMSVVGLALLGVTLFTWIYSGGTFTNSALNQVLGFSFGASSIALFARVGGGIFTKAADVGADLVGKVEQGIPEDDPRNPAVIADNVGDNVGDVAGMGADLFGSCAESTCAAMVISAITFAGNPDALLYPILISAMGIPVSLVTKMLVSVKQEGDVAPALMKLLVISSVLMAIVMFFITRWLIPGTFELGGAEYTSMGVYWCFLSGLVAGLAVGLLTGYYTGDAYKPVQEVAKSCETGVATNIIYGLALGYKSTVLPYLCIAAAIFLSWGLAGMYGVAIASLGMLGTLVIALTIDAYGPVADNAGGIAEMVGLEKEVRRRTDILDSAGNTTAAIGKGFAIGAAILTSLALFAAFITASEKLLGEPVSLSLLDPIVYTSVFIGAVLPFLFTAMTMKSVGKAAFDMIEEVRRQFREIPGIMESKAEPDYAQCVAISTKAALREMIAPGVLIMGTPILAGFLFGVSSVAGILVGSLVAGGVMAIASSNSGGAWDNAKKYIEAGNLGGKGSDVHKAAVVGDTVGDPLKDTSGPSLNILIKLSAILSLVFAPFFVQYGGVLLG
jgi:K(+)-stimulated pyrophosphate-energized sodium pump